MSFIYELEGIVYDKVFEEFKGSNLTNDEIEVKAEIRLQEIARKVFEAFGKGEDDD